MNPALIACLETSPQSRALAEVADWWQVWQSLDLPGAGPAALAIAGGFAADRVGWAFASGYQAALRALVPELPHDTMAALCVTEAEGNRPRHIRTTIVPQPDGALRIDGAKRWTTLGPTSTLLLIVGALPPPGTSKPALRVARVPLPIPSLVLQAMPPTRFVPEVPHAQLLLQDVRVSADALLPHDGYDAYVKPFRTIEDLHVTLAVLAYLLREARARRWPAAFNEELVAALSLLSQLAGEDPPPGSTHTAGAAALPPPHRLYADALPLWAAAGDDPAAKRWRRDTPLFEVAGSAREQRAERAWQRLDAVPATDG
jgi:hypothetical protein